MQRTNIPPVPLASTGSLPPPQVESTLLRIRPKARRSRNLLLDVPIGMRLTLGFLLAGLIASLVTGAIGLQRAQSLNGQSSFYQNLLQTNTKLTTAADFLQLMNTETQNVLTLFNSTQISQETLQTDETAIQGLTNRYDQYLTSYARDDILNQHPEQVALLAEASNADQPAQQETLTASSLRTWRVYRASQNQVIQNVNDGQIALAAHLEQFQGEVTNADAQSALRALILFNERLANSVHHAADIEEQSQLIITIIGSFFAFLTILAIGWFISATIVQRLRQLRQVTQAVEQGQLDRRIAVVGQDEIADVTASVNEMLETIVGLLRETSSQRDALTNAAEHLFSDMRVVSAGDLRVNAPVSNDPIGMLANAFNFTVGRFRRFVQRTKTTAEQIDVLARQELERVETFNQALLTTKSGSLAAVSSLSPGKDSHASQAHLLTEQQNAVIVAQARQAREHLRTLSSEGIIRHTRAVATLAEQISLSIGRLNQSLLAQNEGSARYITNHLIIMQTQELGSLESVLRRMVGELQAVQKHTVSGFQELDNDLRELSTTVQNMKAKVTVDHPEPEGGREIPPEIVRLSHAFANDMATISRQFAKLTQEIRTGIVAFQLDTVDHTGHMSAAAPDYHASGGLKRP